MSGLFPAGCRSVRPWARWRAGSRRAWTPGGNRPGTAWMPVPGQSGCRRTDPLRFSLTSRPLLEKQLPGRNLFVSKRFRSGKSVSGSIKGAELAVLDSGWRAGFRGPPEGAASGLDFWDSSWFPGPFSRAFHLIQPPCFSPSLQHGGRSSFLAFRNALLHVLNKDPPPRRVFIQQQVAAERSNTWGCTQSDSS